MDGVGGGRGVKDGDGGEADALRDGIGLAVQDVEAVDQLKEMRNSNYLEDFHFKDSTGIFSPTCTSS